MKIEEDFNTIYYACEPKVYRLCLGYASGDKELAKEWVQETFIKVWNHRDSFKGNASVETWIYRIAVNTCLGDLRKPGKTVSVQDHYLAGDTDEETLNYEAQIKKMYRCIDQLSNQNKALILLELEETPQAAIAETVGLAYGTLRTRLSRIRKALLKCITNGK